MFKELADRDLELSQLLIKLQRNKEVKELLETARVTAGAWLASFTAISELIDQSYEVEKDLIQQMEKRVGEISAKLLTQAIVAEVFGG